MPTIEHLLAPYLERIVLQWSVSFGFGPRISGVTLLSSPAERSHRILMSERVALTDLLPEILTGLYRARLGEIERLLAGTWVSGLRHGLDPEVKKYAPLLTSMVGPICETWANDNRHQDFPEVSAVDAQGYRGQLRGVLTQLRGGVPASWELFSPAAFSLALERRLSLDLGTHPALANCAPELKLILDDFADFLAGLPRLTELDPNFWVFELERAALDTAQRFCFPFRPRVIIDEEEGGDGGNIWEIRV